MGALALVYGLSHVDWRLARFFQITSLDQLKLLTSNIYLLFNYLAFAERYVYWVAGWNIFNAHPLLGVGLGNAGFYFQHALPAYGWRLPEVMQVYFRGAALPNIKSLWVRLLAETGIVGFSSFIAWCYVMVRTAWSMRLNKRIPFKVIGWCGLFVLIAFVTEGFSTDTFALPYLWISLGIVSAAGALLRNPKEEA
jgi:O-antigen ligase